MATAVSVEESGGNLVVMVTTPGGERASLADSLKNFNCQTTSSVGVRLAEVVLRGVAFAQQLGRSQQLLQRVSRQMPLLLLKEQVMQVVAPCNACKGGGCNLCNGSGYQR